MSSCYLDANVLVYFKDEAAPQFKDARALLERATAYALRLVVSPLVIDEYLHAFHRLLIAQGKSRSECMRALSSALEVVLQFPNLDMKAVPHTMEAQRTVPLLMEQFGLRVRDAYHLLTMRERHVEYFATFDRDFDRVFKASVITQFK